MALDPKRRFYLDGYGQHPEWYTWHYEMLKKLDTLNTSINDQTTQVDVDLSNVDVSFADTASDAFGRLRTSQPFTLFDSNFRYGKGDSLFNFAVFENAGSAYDPNEGCATLFVTPGGAGHVISQSQRVFAYQPGKSLLVLATFVFGQAEPGVFQRVGYFDEKSGLYLEYTQDQVAFVKRTSITGSQTNVTIPQAAWNADKLDGTGPSGITLDPTKAQILWMDIEWLGVGSVRMGFVINGKFILCHTFHHANTIQSTYMTTASLPIRYEIWSVGENAQTVTMKQICSSVISEGGYELRGPQYSVSTPIATPAQFAASDTFYPILSLRLKSTTANAVAVLNNLSLVGLGNGKYYNWRLLRKAATTGGTWNTLSSSNVIEYNLNPTAVTSISQTVVASGFLSSSNQGSPVVNLQKNSIFDLQFERFNIEGAPLFIYEYVLEVAVSDVSGDEGIYAALDWQEIVR